MAKRAKSIFFASPLPLSIVFVISEQRNPGHEDGEGGLAPANKATGLVESFFQTEGRVDLGQYPGQVVEHLRIPEP